MLCALTWELMPVHAGQEEPYLGKSVPKAGAEQAAAAPKQLKITVSQ
jgi:hypothetical protein